MNADALLALANEYALAVEAWFQRVDAPLQQRIEQMRTIGAPHPAESSTADVERAIETIRGYQFFPADTLTKVFSQREAVRGNHPQPQDENEQIHAALTGIDRSLLAWGQVQLFWPLRARQMMRFASLLAELRLYLEWTFPEARDFARSNSDEAFSPLM